MNSMMSWSGGWVFLMAAEIFNVGSRDFRLPGLGSYLQTAASEGNLRAVAPGVATGRGDRFIRPPAWRPYRMTDRFKVDMVEGEPPGRVSI
jgi:NitT/TauT family transport system permease protein